MPHSDDPEDVDPAQVRERTRLAWTRTAIAFAALGAAVLKTSVVAGVTVLALAPLIWQMGHLSHGKSAGTARPWPLLVIAALVATVALAALLLVLLGHGGSAGFHPPDRRR